MKYIFKYILFFFLSLRRDKQYIILNPNLSFLGIKKIFIFDKKKKKFFNYKIHDKYDFITVEEIYFHECYKINNLKIFDEIDIFTKSKKLLIVDCGSNIGCSTNYFLNNYSNSKIISIEPDKKNFEFLKKNVQSNNAILVNNAISSEEIGFEILDSNDNRAKSIIISKDNQLSPKALTINQILDDENNTNYEPFLIKLI